MMRAGASADDIPRAPVSFSDMPIAAVAALIVSGECLVRSRRSRRCAGVIGVTSSSIWERTSRSCCTTSSGVGFGFDMRVLSVRTIVRSCRTHFFRIRAFARLLRADDYLKLFFVIWVSVIAHRKRAFACSKRLHDLLKRGYKHS